MKRVQLTPLIGQQMSGAVCSLLEVDDYRLLLDCGYENSSSCSRDRIGSLLQRVGRIDAILISHGDIDHMGSLPLINSHRPVPVICTLPVFKFGRMVLYDLHLNTELEGNANDSMNMFTLDEIDTCLSNVITIKYNQSFQFSLPSSSLNQTKTPLTICAYPSGRTIGGSVWFICYGAIEIVYAMDINFRKDTVFDAINTSTLPHSPSLMIVEGGIESRMLGNQHKKKKDALNLLDVVMETLRNEGNVLIPSESSGRTLELMYLLDKYWTENKVGLYNLVFLSHMATHILEYARSQLEWMKDSLSKSFYNEKPNPFTLSQVKVVHSMKELNKLSGLKVILCTDHTLNCGLSKEVLLKWSGDPRNRVVFCDYPDRHSLAFTLLVQSFTPPIIVQVTHPERVMISGEELLQHLERVHREERAREDELQRLKLEEELIKVVQHMYRSNGRSLLIRYCSLRVRRRAWEQPTRTRKNRCLRTTPPAKVRTSFSFNHIMGSQRSIYQSGQSKRLLEQSGRIMKFARPWHPMFESREPSRFWDEYGMSNDDLDFSLVNSLVPQK